MIEKYNTFIFDLDGTVYVDDKLIEGADRTINTLTDKGKQIIFVSNKTTGTADDYFFFLKQKGIQLVPEQIITAADVLKKYLIDEDFRGKFFALGENSFINYLQTENISYSENPSEIDLVVVTLDRTLNYQKLEIAKSAINKGAKYYSANMDATCPVSDGEILDAGAIISALSKATNKVPEKNFGKPSSFMFNAIEERLNLDKQKTLIIGDRLETDIKMGNDFGIDTALVSTGIPKTFTDNFVIKPSYKINSVADIILE
jgi:HAD superfamily hydrolase (TIGR01450 family)